MSECLFSIIIPVYKAENTLVHCVDSILSQAPADSELILVDDGSPDNSGLLCDRLAKGDSRIRVIHQENGGASAARNAGLATARGRYIQFVDSDDSLLPGLYSAALPRMEEGADLFFFSVSHLSGSAPDQLPQGWFYDFLTLPGGLADYFIGGGLFLSPVNKIYRASLLQGLSFAPDLRVYEDFHFNLQVLPRCRRLYFCPDSYYQCDDRAEGSLSRSQRADLLDAADRVVPLLLDFLHTVTPDRAAADRLCRDWQCHMVRSQMAVLLGRTGLVGFSDCRRVYRRIFSRSDWRSAAEDWIRSTYTPLPRLVFLTCARLRLAGVLAALCRLRSRLAGF